MELDRRRFLQSTGVIAVAAAGSTIGLEVFLPPAARASGIPQSGTLPAHTPIMVVIDLQGGNDAVNMLINPNDPWYYDNRRGHGAIAIPHSSILPLAGTAYGLHPNLSWTAKQWQNAGNLAFVLGSGENVKHEFSHFAAMYYRNVADFSGSERRGWMGRYNDLAAPGSPLASVSLRGVHPSLIGARTPVLAVTDIAYFDFNVNWQWSSGFLSAWRQMGNGGSLSGTKVQAAAQNVADTFRAQAAVKASYNNTYDKKFGPGLGEQLAQAAMLIEAGLPSQTYVATIGGFDTHGGESYTQGKLLTELDAGLQNFFSTIRSGSRANDVFVLLTSEFGRQQTANASAGCDHGQAGVNMLIGGGVRRGIYGQAPATDPGHRLDDALVPTVDFRSVYATVVNRLARDSGTSSAVLGHAYPDLGVFAAI
jgi:uncharacterized protein (DUF1501 family)